MTKTKTPTKKRTGRRLPAPPKTRKGMGGVKIRGEKVGVCGKCKRRPLPLSGVCCPWCGAVACFTSVWPEEVNNDYSQFGL